MWSSPPVEAAREGEAAMMDMVDPKDQTVRFRVGADDVSQAGYVLQQVYRALEERGYHPVNQIVGYLLSGDPTYITAHRGARRLIRGVRRDELLEELVKHYIKTAGTPSP